MSEDPLQNWRNASCDPPETDGEYLVLDDFGIPRVCKYSVDLSKARPDDFGGRKRPGWYDWCCEFGYYELTKHVNWWISLPLRPGKGDAG